MNKAEARNLLVGVLDDMEEKALEMKFGQKIKRYDTNRRKQWKKTTLS